MTFSRREKTRMRRGLEICGWIFLQTLVLGRVSSLYIFSFFVFRR